jgi:hypothetical protein
MRTIGSAISRMKNLVKGVKHDAFLTDRVIYSLYMKHGKLLLRRQDSQNKLMKFNPVFQTLDLVELIEVDKVQAQCVGLTSDCTIKRTKDKLPAFLEGYWGPIIRSVTSVDGSEEFYPTYPVNYLNITRQKNFKFNKKKYFWFLNGYLYFPDLDWDAVKIEGVFEEDISKFNCNCDDECIQRQDQQLNIPEYLDADIERLVIQDLGIGLSAPGDPQDDKVSPLR